MGFRLVADANRRSAPGKFLGGSTPENLYVSEIDIDRHPRGEGDHATEVVFTDKHSRRWALSAVIYEDCSVQWIQPDQSGPDPAESRVAQLRPNQPTGNVRFRV